MNKTLRAFKQAWLFGLVLVLLITACGPAATQAPEQT